MFGLYLSAEDEPFLDSITDELDQFRRTNDFSSCVIERFFRSVFDEDKRRVVDRFTERFSPFRILLFPSFSSRHRLILHRLRDWNYPDLFSFSLGEERQTRRTIICFKAQLMDETVT